MYPDSKIKKTMIAFLSILKKDMGTYYLKPPNISWGIIFPLAWTLMFFIRTQEPIDVRAILPGVIGMAILFGTTSMLAVTITFERKQKAFDRLIISPNSLFVIIMAKTTGAILFGFCNALVPILFSLFFTSLAGISWGYLLLSVFLISFTSTFLGLFIAVSVHEVFEAQTFSNFFRFPMIFLCGLFIPLGSLPIFLRPISHILPLTYGVDIFRHAINNEGNMPLLLNFFFLVLFALILYFFSMQNIKKKWIY